MTILIVLMPMIHAQPSETFELFAEVPQATKDNTIKITGTTKPNIDITIILNKARVAEIISDSNGDFETDNIILTRAKNEIIIRATDNTGNVKTLTYNVNIDIMPPVVKYKDIPTGSTTKTLTITGTTSEPVTIDWRTSNLSKYTSVQVSDSFSFNINLEDGLNKLELIAQDKAGNTDKQVYEIIHDVAPPKFQSTNLEELEPCYLDFPTVGGKKVDLKGQISEKATIFVYINDESSPSKIRTTDDTGYFRIKDVELTGGTLKTSTTPQQTTLAFTDQYEHKIKITAKDLAGNEATAEKTISCGGCGGGASGYTLNTAASLTAVIPSELLPKLLIQGVETITMPFNLSYTGLNKAVLKNIRATPVLLAPEYEDDYDNDKITVNVIQQNTPNREGATGIIQIQIQKFDPLGTVEPDATNYRKQYNVSKHRFGECTFRTNIKDANYGCMRFFLILEIPYQEETTQTYLDPNLGQTQNQLIRENKVQKICIPHIEIQIDTITDQFIPSKMVRKQIGNIDYFLKKIEPIQKILSNATTYATYTCIASAGTLLLSKLAELTACQIGEWVSTGQARWHSEIAETGMCELVYNPKLDDEEDNPGIKGNERARNGCKACSEITGLRKWIEYEVMHRACDRVGCPAAKTFKSYIQEQKGNPRGIYDSIIKTHFDKAPENKQKEIPALEKEIFDKHGVPVGNHQNKKVYIGNDCGFTDYIDTTYESITPGKRGIKELYQHTKAPAQRDYCTKYLRAARPECCGIKYDQEWGTACGIGRTFGVNIFPADTFDELSESVCYAARQAGQPKAKGTGLDCSGGMLWNALAGFCEPNTGDAVSEVIYTGMHYKKINPDAEKNRIYVFVTPVVNTKKEIETYSVYRGY
ncbi:hypothetical protein GF358_03490, partial [Candidatus Woesearchaeota archaeon]|nr:hypothetical protein [Candidatus Woesearchaeota archaeon]